MDKRFVGFLLTLLIIALLSWALILYARGYRLGGISNGSPTSMIEKTGMLMIKSYPDGAKVYFDEYLKGPTNVSISNVSAGVHNLRIVRDGFFEYSKQIEVFEELVTVVDALLVPLSPSLSPLTYNGVQRLSLNPSGDFVVYSSYSNSEPGGIWKLALDGRPSLLVSDTAALKFSKAEEFFWSPSESEVLVKVGSQYYLLSLNLPNLNLGPVLGESILQTWQMSAKEHEEVRVEKLELNDDMSRIATDSATLWSANKKRFLYRAFDPELQHYQEHTYTLLKPMPVGVKDDSMSFEYPKDQALRVFWYGDSNHLVVVENDKIYLIELDGSNKTLLYSGSFDPSYVFARPGGGGVIILTRFNEDAPPNLYLVGI